MINYDDARLDEIGKRFQAFEEKRDWCAEDATDECLLRLSSAIEEAEQILIEMQPFGNAGIIASQTSLYLAMALTHRARYHFRLGIILAEDEEHHARCVIEDSDRAKEIYRRWGWDEPAGVGHGWRNICLRTLGNYAQAFEEARDAVNVDRSTENYIVLADCHSAIGDYGKAIEAATEAIKLARNDSYRQEAWAKRAYIYRMAGDSVASERDRQQADRYAERLRQRGY